MISFPKSSITFSENTPIEVQKLFCETLQITHDNKPGKYPGIQTELGISKSEALNWVKERIFSKLNGWKGLLLSHGDREILIKSVT